MVGDRQQPSTRAGRRTGADEDDRDHDADTGADRLRGKQFEQHALERSRRSKGGAFEDTPLRTREERSHGRARSRVVGDQRQADPRVAFAVRRQRRRPASP
jgi:hypothetical protein